MGCGCGGAQAAPPQTAENAPNPNGDGQQPQIQDAWWQARPATPMPA